MTTDCSTDTSKPDYHIMLAMYAILLFQRFGVLLTGKEKF